MAATTDFDALIPELRAWNDGAGIDAESWVGCVGSFALAVGYSTVFWPGFVAFEGYVLREGFSVEVLREFAGQPGAVRQDVEAVMNHLHIADLQHPDCADLSGERLAYLGGVLREIYEAKLRWQFPGRRFAVVFDQRSREHLLDYELTFYQVEGGGE